MLIFQLYCFTQPTSPLSPFAPPFLQDRVISSSAPVHVAPYLADNSPQSSGTNTPLSNDMVDGAVPDNNALSPTPTLGKKAKRGHNSDTLSSRGRRRGLSEASAMDLQEAVMLASAQRDGGALSKAKESTIASELSDLVILEAVKFTGFKVDYVFLFTLFRLPLLRHLSRLYSIVVANLTEGLPWLQLVTFVLARCFHHKFKFGRAVLLSFEIFSASHPEHLFSFKKNFFFTYHLSYICLTKFCSHTRPPMTRCRVQEIQWRKWKCTQMISVSEATARKYSRGSAARLFTE